MSTISDCRLRITEVRVTDFNLQPAIPASCLGDLVVNDRMTERTANSFQPTVVSGKRLRKE